MNDALIFAVLIAWLGWAVSVTWALRAGLTRWVFRFDSEWRAYLACYATMLALGFAGALFVDLSGWHFKGMNDEPLEQAGEIVFLLSPAGLPLWVGGPVVALFDLASAWRRSEEIPR